MTEQGHQGGESAVYTLAQLEALVNNANPREIEGREDLEDIRDAAQQMAIMKEAKGQAELARRWKQLEQQASQKLQQTVNQESSEATKACAKCGAKNREQANFCSQCGTSFSGPDAAQSGQQEKNQNKVCSNCGHANRPQARFCAMCGTSLG